MYNTKLVRNMSIKCFVRWLRDRNYFMSPSNKNSMSKNSSKCLNLKRKYKIWWTWSCSWGKYAIIQSCFNVGLLDLHFVSNSSTIILAIYLFVQEISSYWPITLKIQFILAIQYSCMMNFLASTKKDRQLLKEYLTFIQSKTKKTIKLFQVYIWPISVWAKSSSVLEKISF